MALNIEFIEQEWIPALRSKLYQQGQGRLLTIEDGVKQYCCLGVACDLVKERFGYAWREEDGVQRLVGNENVGASMPAEVAEFIGISTNGECSSDPDVAYTENHQPISLAVLNDFSHYTFDQIAAYLEAAAASAKQGVDPFAHFSYEYRGSGSHDAEDGV